MTEKNIEGFKKRQHSRIWNSIGLFSLISYVIYFLYMSVILSFIFPFVPSNFSNSWILYITLLALVAFIFWSITFYLQLNPHFFGEPTKLSFVTKIKVEMLIGLFALIIVVLFLPAYYISIVLPFKASEKQVNALKRLSERKEKEKPINI